MKKLTPSTPLTILLAVAASLLATHLWPSQSTTPTAESNPAYNRVISTNTLRCGYGPWQPAIVKDPKTGQMSGIIVELTEELARSLNLKVEWTTEVEWGQIPIALDSQKIDAHCAGVWADTGKGRGMAFTHPLFYSKVIPIARANDARFDNNPAAINQPSTRIAYGHGEINQEIANHDFPQATLVLKPNVIGDQALVLDVANNKADVTFSIISIVSEFNAQNPKQQVKVVPMPRPIRIFGNTFGVAKNEHQLLNMLNIGVTNLVDNGTVDKILKKYEGKGAEIFTPLALPYQK